MSTDEDDLVQQWITAQLAEPWPLGEHQLDLIRRALAPATAAAAPAAAVA